MSDEEPKEEPRLTGWELVKYRASIAGVIFAILFLFYMLFEGSVFNFDCPFTNFIAFECNRYDPGSKAID
jgi:hypothetical protein